MPIAVSDGILAYIIASSHATVGVEADPLCDLNASLDVATNEAMASPCVERGFGRRIGRRLAEGS